MWLRRIVAALACALLCATAAAQTAAPQSSAKAVRRRGRPPKVLARMHAVRSECVAAAGFCVEVPAIWQRLGNVFGELGFVVAQPHPATINPTNDATWPQLTVAVLPPAEGSAEGEDPPSLDSMVDRMLTPEGDAPPPRTLRRSHLLLNGADAEVVEVLLPAPSGDGGSSASGVIEEVALIAGNGGMVYSVALRCAPEEIERLQPVFDRATASWRLQATASRTPASADEHPQPSSHRQAKPEKP
jgi:hypothetical protein